MTTSNKIFISFLIFLLSGITALYLGSKYYTGIYDKSNYADQKTLLSPFSVVVAEPDALFNLNRGKENKITNIYLKGTVSDIGSFLVRNDTLFISSIQLKKDQVRHTSNSTNVSCVNVKSIIIKEKADVRIGGFQTDTLNITMNKSRLHWNFDSISFVSIQAKDSDIYLNGKKLKNLAVKLDKTNITVYATERIDKLSGSLKDGCLGNFAECNSIRLDADKTSDYSFVILGNHSN